MAVLSEDVLLYLKEKNIPMLFEQIVQNIISDAPERPMSYIGDLMRRGIPLQIFIAGPAGSGKRTQCKNIADRLGVVLISSGQVLTRGVESGSETSQLAHSYVSRGERVPDTLVSMIMKDRLSQSDACEKGWLVEGYPRNAQQAQAVEECGVIPQVFILLDLPEDLSFRRLEHRRYDPATNKEYHMLDNPPPAEDVALCERLVQRDADFHESIAKRLAQYYESIEGVKKHLGAVIEVVDARKSVEDVERDILAAVEKHRFR
ncbi:adenylate kinase, putative [Trypanosoma brucei gambiense DAL972]|uniref:Adenylate kinase, putative n=1 Tax=Trypanosoma brucei gambiense (strain MHOM/CI/86/DAL972) TaxID=679716 RepID=C9ZJR1_TRYB9|nr:adenylate kinase, putative [Trypanosoma brucei gambiense DAL972]CBH09621.1 adenylate kinase, putative [Trypanosoma brucei gambiense DAL972]|eukprot:XP_011771925.1 adenylate kinase, putative [Trypanosoma brucei gambiense DAL972]